MTSTDYSSLQVIADEEEEDNYILLSCKLLVAAAGVVGTRRSCLGCRHIRRRAARFRHQRLSYGSCGTFIVVLCTYLLYIRT